MWNERRTAGAFNSSRYPSIDKQVPCENGLAVATDGDLSNTFRCKNVRIMLTAKDTLAVARLR